MRFNLGGWAKYPDRGRLAAIGASGHEKPVDIGKKQRGPRTGYRGDVSSPVVCVSLGLEHIKVSISAAEVYALAFLIDEKIVCITARIDSCYGATIPRREGR